MILKISKGVWAVSILGVLAALLFVYASLPESVLVFSGDSEPVYLGRETFFYVALIAVTLINTMVFPVSALFKKDVALRTWFNFLVVVLNIFFIISLFVINSINSNEKFKFEEIGFLVYGSVILIAVWTVAWPVYFLIRKFSAKPSV